MRLRTRRQGQWTTWRRAVALSATLHAVVLGALAVEVGFPSVPSAPAQLPWLLPGTPLLPSETPTLVELAIAEVVWPPELGPRPVIPEVTSPMGATVADQAHSVAPAAPHAQPGTLERRVPAPDRGAGDGRLTPDLAWRPDTSTLHERLTDGADVNQPSHARTGRSAASPQAFRRETKIGVGDASRTRHHAPASAPAPAATGVVDPAGPGAAADARPESASFAAVATPARPAPARPELAAVPASQGPLDSDQGRLGFDVPSRAAIASDNQAIRQASNETHPSLMDLTVASVSGNTAEGRGPADTPGAVPHFSRGAAFAPPGVRSIAAGVGDDVPTRERIYNRYVQEIGTRVNQALVWPRALAIRLEQGETVVRFVVLPDGRLGDVAHVIKSSGFAEFDQAALDAVRKASPFPPMREPARARPLSVNLPVNFSNPVIR